jgi:hypothetical protein
MRNILLVRVGTRDRGPHVTGTSQRQRAGRPHRPVFLRCGAVRDGHGNIAIPWRNLCADLNAILNSDPPPAIRFNRDIPPKLEDIMNKAQAAVRGLKHEGTQH